MKHWIGIRPFVFPSRGIGEVVIVTLRFTLLRLILFTEVTAAGFVSMHGIAAHELTQLEEIRESSSVLQRLIHTVVVAENVHVLPKLFAKLLYSACSTK